MKTFPLGRRIPPDTKHIENYPLRLASYVEHVEIELPLPSWHKEWNQGSEGACVGFGSQMAEAIIDGKRFDPFWLWNEAKKVDVWTDTNPGDDNGTSVRAAMDVLRVQGNKSLESTVPDPRYGIQENRWATNINEMRTVIANKVPISIGVNWYQNFDTPQKKNDESWIGEGDLGNIRGGHCVCVYGASDARSAFKIKNSWGSAYPEVWMPYTTMQRLLNEQGEATMITDKLDLQRLLKRTSPLTKGEDVKQVQQKLTDLGFLHDKVDGYFGEHTKQAVIAFQKAHGLVSDGIVGVKTYAALDEAKKKL